MAVKKKNQKDKKADRKKAVEDAKPKLNDVFAIMAPFKAEQEPISIELTPFQPEDIAPAMPGRNFQHERVAFTEKVIADILNHIVNYGVIAHACLESGVSYRNWEQLCKAFQGLNDLKEEAKDLYRDKVSRCVHNRAIDGWLEPVYYKGDCVGFVRKFSDRMLELQAKRFIPEYRDKSAMDLNVAGGVLVVNSNNIEDKEAWLEEQRKRRRIESHTVGGDEQ